MHNHPTTERILAEIQNLEEIRGLEAEEYIEAINTLLTDLHTRKTNYLTITRDQSRPSLDEYRLSAKAIHEVDGETEIDPEALVSVSDDEGAYVQAWVWVYDEDVRRVLR